MNLMEELRALDPREPGRWPLPIRIGAVAIWLVVLTFILAYVFVWTNERPLLDQYQQEEQKLRQEFRTKHAQAVNLSVYKQQLADIERSFGALLRELPGRTEVPNLVVDIAQTGTGGGTVAEAVPARHRSEEGFLRGTADQDPLQRQLSPVRPVRQRHRGAAAHRHAA